MPFNSPNTHKGRETKEGSPKTGSDRNNLPKAAAWPKKAIELPATGKGMPAPRRKTPQSSAATQKAPATRPAKTNPQPLAKPASKTGKGVAAGTRKIVKGK